MNAAQVLKVVVAISVEELNYNIEHSKIYISSKLKKQIYLISKNNSHHFMEYLKSIKMS